jgi:hypothetical protein
MEGRQLEEGTIVGVSRSKYKNWYREDSDTKAINLEGLLIIN